MEKLIKANEGYEVLDRLFSRIQSNGYVVTQNMLDKTWEEWCELNPANIERSSSESVSVSQSTEIAPKENHADKKDFYAITTSMTFEKTVLVPVNCVDDIDDAIDLVNYAIEAGGINIIERDPLCCTTQAAIASKSGICSMTETESSSYQILH